MTNKASRYCKAYPCNRVAVNGAYCDEHRPAPALKEVDEFYVSTRWRNFRNWYLGKFPLCALCEREGRLVRAAMVDHILEISDGGALTSEENAMSLCWKCHAIKTAMVKSRRKNHQQSKADNRIGSTEES